LINDFFFDIISGSCDGLRDLLFLHDDIIIAVPIDGIVAKEVSALHTIFLADAVSAVFALLAVSERPWEFDKGNAG
jgi:hypothetical protein